MTYAVVNRGAYLQRGRFCVLKVSSFRCYYYYLLLLLYLGRGIGNVITRIFGRLIPFFRKSGASLMKSATSKAAKKVAKNALKSAGKSALKAAGNAALNALEGKPVKKGVQEDLASARKKIANVVRRGIPTSSSSSSPSSSSPATLPRGSKNKNRDRPRSLTVTPKTSVAKRKSVVKTILD